MTVAIVGAGGMLGRAMARAAGEDALALTRAELDVTDAAAVAAALAEARPDVVVNCAAYTDVDAAEAEPERALVVNRDGARNVAAAAPRVVYVSSDYVFDGRKREPYVESDATGPLGSYGRSKLAGEIATAGANPRCHIVRTSWLFGAHGRNFVDTMLRLGSERDHVRVVDDQVGCPTYVDHLAPALLTIAASDDYGVRHLAGGGACSWFELAGAIFERAGVDCRVEPCASAEMPRPAPRPGWSVLRSERAEPVALPDWREGLDAYLAEREVRA